VSFRLGTTSTQIEICFGDLFGFEGQKAIPVNEYFESSLDGDHVSERSVHGQFIKRKFSGVPQGFDALVEKSLSSVPSEHVDRPTGKNLKYPLGTTAMMNLGSERFYLVAVCATDIKTLKASSDVTQLWIALLALWEKVRTGNSGEEINVPLFGGGLAGIGLPSMQLLQLLVLSIVVATRKSTVATKIRIVLHESKFEEFDLRTIRRDWS
jgi:hypothetical protein